MKRFIANLQQLYFQVKVWNCERAIRDIERDRLFFRVDDDFAQRCIEYYKNRIRVLTSKIENLNYGI